MKIHKIIQDTRQEFIKFFLSLEKKEEKFINVTVSGGLDSLVLAKVVQEQLALYKAPSNSNCNLSIRYVHINENSRPYDLMVCKKVREYFSKSFLIVLECNENSCLSESAAHDERMRLLNQFGQSLNTYPCILQAHHANDAAEHCIMRLIGGGELTVLKEFSPQEYVKIWRPLLKVKKKDIKDFAQQRKIAPLAEDPDNEDTSLMRVFVRKNIIPQLEQLSGKAVINIQKHLKELKEAT